MITQVPPVILNQGLTAYADAWALQRRLWAERVAGERPDTFLILQHPHTYTLGVRANHENILWKEAERKTKGIEMVQIDRGGDITYHGPGQVVVYPILNLQERRMDLHRYLRALEELVIGVMAEYGVEGLRIPEFTGVWVAKKNPSQEVTPGGVKIALGESSKIAAIGIKVSKWVTMHGVAFNVDPDLAYFSGIVPCGLCGKSVTSLREVLGRPVDPEEVASKMVVQIGRVFS